MIKFTFDDTKFKETMTAATRGLNAFNKSLRNALKTSLKMKSTLSKFEAKTNSYKRKNCKFKSFKNTRKLLKVVK